MNRQIGLIGMYVGLALSGFAHAQSGVSVKPGGSAPECQLLARQANTVVPGRSIYETQAIWRLWRACEDQAYQRNLEQFRITQEQENERRQVLMQEQQARQAAEKAEQERQEKAEKEAKAKATLEALRAEFSAFNEKLKNDLVTYGAKIDYGMDLSDGDLSRRILVISARGYVKFFTLRMFITILMGNPQIEDVTISDVEFNGVPHFVLYYKFTGTPTFGLAFKIDGKNDLFLDMTVADNQGYPLNLTSVVSLYALLAKLTGMSQQLVWNLMSYG